MRNIVAVPTMFLGFGGWLPVYLRSAQRPSTETEALSPAPKPRPYDIQAPQRGRSPIGDFAGRLELVTRNMGRNLGFRESTPEAARPWRTEASDLAFARLSSFEIEVPYPSQHLPYAAARRFRSSSSRLRSSQPGKATTTKSLLVGLVHLEVQASCTQCGPADHCPIKKGKRPVPYLAHYSD